ncbi:hypothetical protein K432DRAFT_309581 [Lepidopterella palustris CBS 459.81]|uniref:Rhodopsin domain-containing protein n=1 Tax=Lepidopterella palustris CBS 459.81 TaxID=1314670 RepID=A0A8E2JA33_9PEZI|nr:hypothetical protein K432DRAFT_309581 [Lepidopterella palustris CBS 459.81]
MDDRSHEVLAVAIFFLILSWVTVSLRVYVRAGMLKSFGLDDWIMVLTLLLFTVYLACQIGGVIYGTGRHIANLKPQNAEKALHFWYLCELFYILSTCMLKIALGVFLLRVAVRKLHIWIIRLVMLGTIVFGTSYFFLVLFQCGPVSEFWMVSPGSSKCLNTKVITGTTYAAGALTTVSDWTFGILPIFIVWDLKISRKAKFMVAGILAFAAIGSTATIVRIPYVHGLAETSDFLWTTTDIAIWSTVEPGIGITAGCIATLRPILQVVLWRTGLSMTVPTSAHWLGAGRGQKRQSHFGYHRNYGLDELRPDKVGTITSVTGPQNRSRRDRSTSEERMVGKGINKEVVVEHTTEASDAV